MLPTPTPTVRALTSEPAANAATLGDVAQRTTDEMCRYHGMRHPRLPSTETLTIRPPHAGHTGWFVSARAFLPRPARCIAGFFLLRPGNFRPDCHQALPIIFFGNRAGFNPLQPIASSVMMKSLSVNPYGYPKKPRRPIFFIIWKNTCDSVAMLGKPSRAVNPNNCGDGHGAKVLEPLAH